MALAPSRYIFAHIPWYGFLIAVGIMIAFVLSDKEAVRQLLPKDTMVDLAIRILPVGILGARIYYVLFSWDSFADNVLSVFYIWEGGLAIYGGLIAGFLTVLFFLVLAIFLLYHQRHNDGNDDRGSHTGNDPDPGLV